MVFFRNPWHNRVCVKIKSEGISVKHIKKIVVIVIVVVIFGIYTIRQRLTTPGSLGENVRPAKSSVSQSNSSPAPNQSSNSSTDANNNSTGSSSALFKDGSYVGQTADAYYGYVQVKATVSGAN